MLKQSLNLMFPKQNMKKTIADILIQNFDANNYATKSILSEKMKSMKYKFRNLSNSELEKLATQKLKNGETTKNKPTYLDFINAEEKLKKEKSAYLFKIRRKKYWDSLTQEEKKAAWSRWNKKRREKLEYLKKEKLRKKLYYQKNRERLIEKAKIRYQNSIKIN